MQILEIVEQYIHCEVTLLNSGRSFLVTVLYAQNEPDDRVCLWEALRRLHANIVKPWIIGDDFNTTLLQEERIKNGSVWKCNTAELRDLFF